MTRQDNWGARFVAWLAASPAGSAVAVVFPEYRPDLVEVVAQSAGAEFLDFRQTAMAPLGWRASSLPLGCLLEVARERLSRGHDLVLQNAEALLSLVSPDRRRLWFAETLSLVYPARLILPVALYGSELPAGHRNVYVLDQAELPETSLLARLSGLR